MIAGPKPRIPKIDGVGLPFRDHDRSQGKELLSVQLENESMWRRQTKREQDPQLDIGLAERATS